MDVESMAVKGRAVLAQPHHLHIVILGCEQTAAISGTRDFKNAS